MMDALKDDWVPLNGSFGACMKIVTCVFVLIFSLVSTNLYAEDAPAKAATLSINTNAYLDKMAIPTLFTCDGTDASPQLTWSDAPAKTVTYAIIMSDVDAPKGTFYHWVLYNIPKNVTSIDQGAGKPSGATFGKNSFDKLAYSGPCPPKGTARNYIISLYALDTKLDIPNNADAKTVLSAMKNHILSQAEYTGVYSRWIQ